MDTLLRPSRTGWLAYRDLPAPVHMRRGMRKQSTNRMLDEASFTRQSPPPPRAQMEGGGGRGVRSFFTVHPTSRLAVIRALVRLDRFLLLLCA